MPITETNEHTHTGRLLWHGHGRCFHGQSSHTDLTQKRTDVVTVDVIRECTRIDSTKRPTDIHRGRLTWCDHGRCFQGQSTHTDSTQRQTDIHRGRLTWCDHDRCFQGQSTHTDSTQDEIVAGSSAPYATLMKKHKQKHAEITFSNWYSKHESCSLCLL